MPSSYDLVLRGGTAVTPSGVTTTDIAIADGKIVALGDLRTASAAAVFEAKGLHLLPGLIDTQVHFREPGSEHKEDLATGTRGAILGGITAVFEMPNTDPLTLTQADLADKLARAKGRAWCDHAFFIGGAAENATELPRLERLPGCSGVKVFMGSSHGNLLVEDDPTLQRIVENGSRRMAVHAEDEPRLKERRAIAVKEGHPRAHPVWRDEEVCLKATRRLLVLARKAGRRVHVLHVTTADEMGVLAEHKHFVTVEVTPNHLFLTAPECYERLGTYAQMNPPVRDKRHQDALWRAIAEGVVDVIGSDHAPHTKAEKDRRYPDSPSGMPGVQTTVPLFLDAVSKGRLSLERLVDLLGHGPQRIYQIAGKGRIAVGYDGDLTVVDLNRRHRISSKEMATRAGWTPYDGVEVTGWPVATIIRGRTVMRDGEVLGEPQGQPVRFQECLPV
jgi:dihydroorotase